jgi:hypothetical protein
MSEKNEIESFSATELCLLSHYGDERYVRLSDYASLLLALEKERERVKECDGKEHSSFSTETSHASQIESLSDIAERARITYVCPDKDCGFQISGAYDGVYPITCAKCQKTTMLAPWEILIARLQSEKEKMLEELKALMAENVALAKWKCGGCGCRFEQLPKPEFMLEGVTRCSKCAENEVLANLLAQAQQERDEAKERMASLERMLDGLEMTMEENAAIFNDQQTKNRQVGIFLQAFNDRVQKIVDENAALKAGAFSLQTQLAAKEEKITKIIALTDKWRPLARSTKEEMQDFSEGNRGAVQIAATYGICLAQLELLLAANAEEANDES